MMKTNVVLVGCGGIANAWLNSKTVKSKVNIVGMVDLQQAAAEAKKEKFGLVNAITGSNLDTVLRQVKPEVVFDCTIPEAHCATTLTALKHGCHVFGEKPGGYTR
jgi:predicted dehydrogenase